MIGLSVADLWRAGCLCLLCIAAALFSCDDSSASKTSPSSPESNGGVRESARVVVVRLQDQMEKRPSADPELSAYVSKRYGEALAALHSKGANDFDEPYLLRAELTENQNTSLPSLKIRYFDPESIVTGVVLIDEAGAETHLVDRITWTHEDLEFMSNTPFRQVAWFVEVPGRKIAEAEQNGRPADVIRLPAGILRRQLQAALLTNSGRRSNTIPVYIEIADEREPG